MYEEGIYVEENIEFAAKCYEKAAELGNMHAQFQIGLMCEAGVGTDEDVVKAIKWYTLAAKQQNKRAERRLYELLNG